MDNQFFVSTDPNAINYNLFMTFNLESKVYAAPAKNIVEVIKLPMLDKPENLPENIIGIVNLRGSIINILDIRKLLGVKPTLYTTDNCILVLTAENETWGIIVDAVNNVININMADITNTPYAGKRDKSVIRNVAKTENGLIGVINLEYLSKIVTEFLEEGVDPVTLLGEGDASVFFPISADTKSLEVFNKRAKELQSEIKLSTEEQKVNNQRFVTFLLNNELYAIGLQNIREFSKIINLALIPCVPEFYVGLSNLRGEFIPVIDIKGFLGISKSKITDKGKIIFVKSAVLQVGIIVDEVFDIINVPASQINKSGILVDKHKYTVGEIICEDNTIINIFDIEKFLQDERLIIEEAV